MAIPESRINELTDALIEGTDMKTLLRNAYDEYRAYFEQLTDEEFEYEWEAYFG